MIFVPVAGALYGPPTAVATIFLVDTLVSAPMAFGAIRLCQWRQVLTLLAGAVVTVPAGAWLLLHVDPTPLRWGISLYILGAVALLASGWRYKAIPGTATTVAVGASSGLMSGMASLGGPPVVLFWLGGGNQAAVVRANIIAYFFLNSINSGIAFVTQGLFNAERLGFAAALAPVYVAGICAGIYLFRFASESFYRRLAFALCALAALSSLPLWA
jgi:uncharacterized membrane protein YfcA